jgi:glycosyltransferase involved in cell wall biosynthesis
MDIALCVMVKNEEATLPRLLDSVKGFATKIIALDTGSTDGTLTILREAGADVLESPFKNFGESRTELMQFAKGKADWLLLLDADHTLKFDDGRDRDMRLVVESTLLNALAENKPGFSLLHDGELAYWVPRLVRGNRDWKFYGATHEYLDTCCHTQLEGLLVVHHADGGSRSDKSTRDFRLLTEELEREPNNSRTVFYLANTCRDLGQRLRARELYIKRVTMGGWDEEIFVARLEAAKLSLDPLELWECWSTRPTRAEPLYWLERLYRDRAEDVYAFSVEMLRRNIKIPKDDILFVERAAYFDGPLDPLPAWTMIPGWWYVDEEEFYKRLIALIPDGGKFTEVGTWVGRSFACFDYWAKKHGKKIFKTAVDTFRGTDTEPTEIEAAQQYKNGFFAEFMANMDRCGVTEYKVEPLLSTVAATEKADGSQDAVFLDGDHTTEAVLADIRAWVPKIRSGGYIAGHDFDRSSVRDAVLAWFPEDKVRVYGRCWITQLP